MYDMKIGVQGTINAQVEWWVGQQYSGPGYAGYETEWLLSQEHHLYVHVAAYNTWNQKRQSNLGIGCLEGRVADRQVGLTC